MGENILDNWSLVHLAFRQSPVLKFGRTRVEVADGQSLGGLGAAPLFADLWKEPQAASVLLTLVTKAQSRLIRVWTIQLLKRDHASTLQTITAEQLLARLNHCNDAVQH